jgi:hypothetical protein
MKSIYRWMLISGLMGFLIVSIILFSITWQVARSEGVSGTTIDMVLMIAAHLLFAIIIGFLPFAALSGLIAWMISKFRPGLLD